MNSLNAAERWEAAAAKVQSVMESSMTPGEVLSASFELGAAFVHRCATRCGKVEVVEESKPAAVTLLSGFVIVHVGPSMTPRCVHISHDINSTVPTFKLAQASDPSISLRECRKEKDAKGNQQHLLTQGASRLSSSHPDSPALDCSVPVSRPVKAMLPPTPAKRARDTGVVRPLRRIRKVAARS